MSDDQRMIEALMRSDFRAFLQKTFHTLAPGQAYIRTWHLDAIAWQLERVRRGEIKRLIINMPPRSLKSIAASVAFPAYILGHDPSRRIICVSYSADLAKKHSNDFRALVETRWYKTTFPTTRVGQFKNNETEVEFTARGFRLATSVGGTLTGRGGDIIIIDDPLKPDDAFSETKRNHANHWFTNTLASRLDDKRTGAIVVVMQRVHMDDLSGFLTEQSDEWEILNLPAIAEHDHTISCWEGALYHRRAGEVLSPEREPLAVLEALKLQLGSDAFYAQYQQMPVPPGGAMVKREWIKRYEELPQSSDQRIILQSWDTAAKGGPNNDWSVCTTWILTRNKQYHLIDVWRGRVDYPTLKAKVIELANKWQARRVLVEDTSSGIMLIQEIKRFVRNVIAVRPEGDKEWRMAVATSKFESGLVFFPKHAPWLADMEAELFAFPVGRHDDQCDSISQALLDRNLGPFEGLSKEDWARLIAKARQPSKHMILKRRELGIY